jgi:hypothetical protein
LLTFTERPRKLAAFKHLRYVWLPTYDDKYIPYTYYYLYDGEEVSYFAITIAKELVNSTVTLYTDTPLNQFYTLMSDYLIGTLTNKIDLLKVGDIVTGAISSKGIVVTIIGDSLYINKKLLRSTFPINSSLQEVFAVSTINDGKDFMCVKLLMGDEEIPYLIFKENFECLYHKKGLLMTFDSVEFLSTILASCYLNKNLKFSNLSINIPKLKGFMEMNMYYKPVVAKFTKLIEMDDKIRAGIPLESANSSDDSFISLAEVISSCKTPNHKMLLDIDIPQIKEFINIGEIEKNNIYLYPANDKILTIAQESAIRALITLPGVNVIFIEDITGIED